MIPLPTPWPPSNPLSPIPTQTYMSSSWGRGDADNHSHTQYSSQLHRYDNPYDNRRDPPHRCDD
uniref:Uncharacterized protein n=1 Tax=Romanomermis culicivorax TaxID=13658 RepID=A0A915HYW2_ROMCU